MNSLKKVILRIQKNDHLLLIAAIGIFLLFTLYKLDTLPGEWYGDISIVHLYVAAIVNGEWPLFFITSAGPLYPYLIAPIISFFGISYFIYKLLSVITGLLGVIGIYLFASTYSGSKKIGGLAALVASVSFMYWIWSRLGNFNIIVPVLTAFMGYFLMQYIEKRQWKDLFGGVIVSSLGLLTYPGLFPLPGVFLFLLAFGLYTSRQKHKKSLRTFFIALLSFIPIIGLFAYIVVDDWKNFSHGYIGSKIYKQNTTVTDNAMHFGNNLIKTAGMLHVQGDVAFRVNVSKSPHLDPVSGVFFFVGLFYVLFRFRAKATYLIFPLVILALPGASPGLPVVDMPNTARTLGILPLVYLVVAYGIWAVYLLVRKYINPPTGFVIVYFCFFIILALNCHKYFIEYANGLPDQNTAFGRIIGHAINDLPENTDIFITDCCWGAWSQPELRSIYFSVTKKAKRDAIQKLSNMQDCSRLITRKNTYVIFNPKDEVTIRKARSCFPEVRFQKHIVNGYAVFSSLYILRQ
jgi:hypothetical protein